METEAVTVIDGVFTGSCATGICVEGFSVEGIAFSVAGAMVAVSRGCKFSRFSRETKGRSGVETEAVTIIDGLFTVSCTGICIEGFCAMGNCTEAFCTEDIAFSMACGMAAVSRVSRGSRFSREAIGCNGVETEAFTVIDGVFVGICADCVCAMVGV